MNNQDTIWVSVEGEAPITLTELIRINNGDGEEAISEQDIEDIERLPVGEALFLNICEVVRIS